MMDRHRYLNVLIEAVKDFQQSVYGKPRKAGVADSAEIVGRKAGLGVGLAHGQLSAFQRLHDFDAKQRLQLQSVG